MYVALGNFGQDEVAFIEKELGGITYRVANDKLRSNFQMGLAGWKVRDTSLSGLGHDVADIELDKTETAVMTPYNESTGPRDPGDGYSWIDHRRAAGRGIIIVPPTGWSPSDSGDATTLLRQTTGEITAIATEDFDEVQKHAALDKSGFVLAEPAEGWEHVGATPSIGETSTKTLLVAAGVIVVAVGAGFLLFGRD